MFKGSIPALITPFDGGEIDWPAFDRLIEWQIESGSHALVPCGTTGESPTLSEEEAIAIIKRCVDVVNKRVPVIAGTGSNATAKTISMTKTAKEAGADAALIVAPYYNKPTQEGLYQHFKTVAEQGGLPVIVYNIPGRSIVDISSETMTRLARIKNIVGVKDATNDVSRATLTRLALGPDFVQLSGEDGTVCGFLAQGGHGCISVTANVAPRLCADLHNAWKNGDLKTVAELRDRLAPLSSALFCETSPAPAKYALSRLGLCKNELRLPLVPVREESQAKIDEAMNASGLPAAPRYSAPAKAVGN